MDMEDALLDAGFEIVSATNSADAMSLLTLRRDISVVITDLKMPGETDGLGLIHCVQKRWPSVRTIITTGYSGAADIPDGVPVFTKPIVVAELLSKAQQMMAV
jgi:DNA-binding NtrC family response regulator